MSTKRDYYDVLEVSKDSSAPDIKKAYRKLALKWHPDRNKTEEAAEKFKEINEAYEILSNPQKKQTYDQYGHSPFGPGVGGDAGGPFGGSRTYKQGPFTYSYASSGGQEGSDFGGFSDPFEIFEQFFGGGSPFRQGPQMSRYGLTLSFMDAARGCEKEFVIKGKKRKIRIPAGVDDGSRIKFPDFYITIDVKSDKVFQRDGADIFVDQEIPLKMAILGGTMEVPTIEDNIKIRVRPGTQSGTMLRLANRGINKLHGFGKGDQYVRLLIKIPQKLTRAQKEALEGL